VFASDTAQPTNGSGSSGRRRSGASRPLFGDSGGGEDIFAAPAAAAPSSGGDLFGSASAHSAAASEPRWPSSGGSASMAGHDGGRVENLTGQRHENSVLFSLANLQSLAMPSAKPAAAASFAAAPAPTTEGSGLIDIRAMAASTRSAPLDGPSTAVEDDLPAFGAFSPAAPVLLPLPSQSGPSKLIYIAIAGMLLLVVAIGWLAYRVIAPKEVVVEKVVQVQVPAAAAPAGAAKGAGEVKEPSKIKDEDLPPREGGKEASGKEGDKGKEGKEKGTHHRSASGKDATKKGPVAAAEEKKGPAAAPNPGEPPKPKPGSLEALLNDAAPQKKGPKVSEDRGEKAGGGESAGPLNQRALVAGFNAVRPKVSACFNQFKVPGTAMVNVQISKSGKVTKADVTGKFAGTPTGQCVEAAVKTASFPPSDGFSTPYPFQLR
jgi:hypothetical protein